MSINLKTSGLNGFVDEAELEKAAHLSRASFELLMSGKGAGNDFLGWLDLPVNYDRVEFGNIKNAAAKIRSDSEVLVVIGIGGSYLGARAAIEFLHSELYNSKCKKYGAPEIYFAGNSISASHLNDIISIIGERDFSVNVISKSGTTTEPAIAFRVLRSMLEKKYGKDGARGRIYATTDRARGALKNLADGEGYATFVVPDDIGGRYSVLSAVGLLPIAAAGADIDAIMEGAAAARSAYASPEYNKNDALKYAVLRHILGAKGKTGEILVSYEPSLCMFAEWFKQLFAESQGKDGKGIFPMSASFSTDLHSIGQYIQQGQRNIFETVLWSDTTPDDLVIEKDEADIDGLNFLAGSSMQYVNSRAYLGTMMAHCDGSVPNIVLNIDGLNEKTFGELVYFFELACAVGGYMEGVNPFDQPGVESYKKNMFALLGKPGYEALRDELESRLNG